MTAHIKNLGSTTTVRKRPARALPNATAECKYYTSCEAYEIRIKQIGAAIKSRRLALGMTQQQLGEATGVSPEELASIEEPCGFLLMPNWGPRGHPESIANKMANALRVESPLCHGLGIPNTKTRAGFHRYRMTFRVRPLD